MDKGQRRTESQREADLAFIAEKLLLGWSQFRIGEWLANERNYTLASVTIRNDINELKKRWREEQSSGMAEAQALEMARLDSLMAAYWDGWTQSIGTAVETITITKDGEMPTKEGRVPGYKSDTTETREKKLNGDPRYLKGVWECIDMRLKVMGAYTPVELELGFKNEMIKHGFDETQTEAVLMQLEDVFLEHAKSGLESATTGDKKSAETDASGVDEPGVEPD